MVRASLADPTPPSDRLHGTTHTYYDDTKYIQRKHDTTRRTSAPRADLAARGGPAHRRTPAHTRTTRLTDKNGPTRTGGGHSPPPHACAPARPPSITARGLRARPTARAARAAPRRRLRHAHLGRVGVVVVGSRRPPSAAVAKVAAAPAHAPEPLSTAGAGISGWCGGGAGGVWACVKAACGGCARRGRTRARRHLPEPVTAPEARVAMGVQGPLRAGCGGPRTAVACGSWAARGPRRLREEVEDRLALANGVESA